MSGPAFDPESIRRRGPVLLIGLAVVVVAVLLQAAWLKPPFPYDATDYLMAARKLGNTIAHHRTLRIGLLFPFWAAVQVFGESQFAFHFVPFLAVALITGGTYALGVLLFSRPAAAAAAVVTVFNPLVLNWSSQPYPDLLATGWFVVGLAFLVASLQSVPRSWGAGALATGAGLLFGWSYLTRELMVFLFPLVAVALILWKAPWRRAVQVAAASASALLIEWGWGAWAFDDAFIRWRVLVGSQAESGGGAAIEAGVEAMRNQPVLQRIGTFVDVLASSAVGPLWIGLLALALFGLVVGRRDRGIQLIGGWFVIWYVFLTVANFAEVLRTSDLVRYWYPLMPAYGLLAFLGLERLMRTARVSSQSTRVVVSLVAVLAVGLTWNALADVPGYTRNGSNEYEDFRSWLATADDPPPVIWSDQRTTAALRLYTRSFFGTESYYKPEDVLTANDALRFRSVGELHPAGSFVLRGQLFRTRLSNWREVVPAYMADPPWHVTFISSNSDLVILDMESDAGGDELYSVGASADHGWRILDPVVNEMTEDPGPGPMRLSIPSGDRAVVGDDTSRGMGAAPRTATVAAGTSLRFDFELDVAPDQQGWITFACSLWDGEGRRRIEASTAWRPELKLPRGSFFCAVPGDMTEPVAVRGVLEVTGPMDLELVGMTAGRP